MEKSKEFIFGLRPVIEAIESGKEIERVLLQRDLKGNLAQELLLLAANYKIPVVRVPIEKLNTVTRKNHQGVICFVSPVIYASLDHVITEAFSRGKAPLILVLDRITDVRNVGAMARTAECFGVDALVVPSRGGAQLNADAIKTSAGAFNYIPVCREDNLKGTLKFLKESGLSIVACTEKAETWIYEADLHGPVAVIMGSEENGISEEYLKRADQKVKIPQTGKIESLNVSVATGIILSEVVRQRNYLSIR